MLHQSSICAFVLAAALFTTIDAAPAFDDAMYPDWKGAWNRTPEWQPPLRHQQAAGPGDSRRR